MSLLYVHRSPVFRTAVARIAEAAELHCREFHDNAAALVFLAAREPASLFLVEHGSGDGKGFRMIEEVRLFAHRATLPIACILETRDLAAAREAFRAGVTEVFQETDDAGLRSFVREFSGTAKAPSFNGRVLLLEDSASHMAFVSHLCGELGLSVDTATTVEEGLALFAANTYQIAVIDIVLEGIQSGLALVREIRRQTDGRGNIPVLVMSGFTDVARRIEALRCGASDFLHKPFAAEEFVWRLRRLLQEQAHEDLTESLDTTKSPGSGFSAGANKWRNLGLTPREAEICESLLVGSADKVIAEKLGISFWTVRTHIQRIFTKLGVLNRRELIVRYLTAREPA